MRIENRKISLDSDPFIIAELSGNHNKSLNDAKKIISKAADAGVDAIKLQTYTPDTLTIKTDKEDFIVKNNKSLWHGENLYDLYSEAYTPWEWHEELIELCKSLNIICFSTPFDESSVDFLEDLDVPAYKIASFENNHIPLIKKVLSTGKPLLVSTGMASLSDLETIKNLVEISKIEHFALLKCTSTYPAQPKNSNLRTIPVLRNIFNCEVGLSDHTLGIGAAIAAVSQGATIIEKHITLSRKNGGVDSSFSLEPIEFKSLVSECKIAHQSLGGIHFGAIKDEESSQCFRRSIYISKDIKKGEIVTKHNIKVIRPGYGLKPKHYSDLLGLKFNENYKRGTPLSWKMIN